MAEDLVLDERDVFGAPAPLAHVGAVAFDQELKAVVEGARQDAPAVGIGFVLGLWLIAPSRMFVDQRQQRRGVERPIVAKRHSDTFLDEDAMQRGDERRVDQRLGLVLVHHAVPCGEKRKRLARPLVGRLIVLSKGWKSRASSETWSACIIAEVSSECLSI